MSVDIANWVNCYVIIGVDESRWQAFRDTGCDGVRTDMKDKVNCLINCLHQSAKPWYNSSSRSGEQGCLRKT